MFNAPIIITGCPRSRTSLVAGLIEQMGAFGGNTVPGGPQNPKGFFENIDIRQNMVKPYLESQGWCRLGQQPLPPKDTEKIPVPDTWRDEVYAYLKQQGYKTGKKWYTKDCKNLLIWPVWAAHFPAAQWVYVARNPKDIAASCARTNFMRVHGSDSAAWMRYVDEHLTRLDVMRDNGVPVTEISSDKIIMGDYSEIRQFCVKVGLDWSDAKAHSFVLR